MMGLVQTPVKMTQNEILTSSAITLCLLQLEKENTLTLFIKELCSKPQYGLTASASKTPSGQRFVRITDIQQGVVDWESVPFCECEDPNKYKLTKGDLLIARTGSIGKSFLVPDVPELAVFASYLIRLHVNSGILPEYIYWCFQSQQFWRQIMSARRGSVIKNINAKMLQLLRFPLPAIEIQESIVEFVGAFQKRLGGSDIDLPELSHPLDEQRRIVAQIEELAAKIDEAQKLRRKVSERELPGLRDVAFRKAFQGKAVSQNSSDEPALVTLDKVKSLKSQLVAEKKIKKDTPIPPISESEIPYQIPGSWEWVRLGDLCSLITDGTHQTPKYTDEGMMFLSAQNVKPYKFMPQDHRYVSHEDYLSYIAHAKPEKNDILMTRVGAMIGEAAVIDQDIDFAFYVSLCLIRPFKDCVYVPYLLHWLNSPYGAKSSRKNTLGRGHSQGNLNLNLIRRFVLPFPPLNEQRRIVAHLDELQAKVDALKKYQAQSGQELDALLPSVLDKAFKGEL